MPVQVQIGARKLSDYLVRVPNITEAQFDILCTEDTPFELLDGEMIVHSPASFEHEEICAFLIKLLGSYVDDRDLGWVVGSNTVLHLRPGRKLEPDVSFLARRREPTIGWMVEGTADLVIEVLSHTTRDYDLGDKRKAYRDARTPEIWLIDPEKKHVTIDVRQGRAYRSRGLARGRLVSKAVPGFFLDVAWLWQRPLPRLRECLALLPREP